MEQALPSLKRQLAQQRQLLSALTGGLPSEGPPEKFTLAAIKLPRDLPVSVPSQLVQPRPDLRAAEENLHSASAQVGVAVANRLPNLTLTGNVGSTAPQIAQLFTPETGRWPAPCYSRSSTPERSTRRRWRSARPSSRRRRSTAARS